MSKEAHSCLGDDVSALEMEYPIPVLRPLSGTVCEFRRLLEYYKKIGRIYREV